MLKWLDDGEDNIYIPGTPSPPPQQNTPSQPLHHPSCSSSTPSFPQASESSVVLRDDEVSSSTAVRTSAAPPSAISHTASTTITTSTNTATNNRQHTTNGETISERHQAVEALETNETAQRCEVMLSESDARGLLSACFWRHAAASLDKELTKSKTMMHNRELISSDLLQELYQANKQQRVELQQVMGLFQQIAGSRAGSGGGGQRRK